MHTELPNNTFTIVVMNLQATLYMQLVVTLKKGTAIKSYFTYFVCVVLGFIMGIIASTICHDRPSLAGVFWRHQLGCH